MAGIEDADRQLQGKKVLHCKLPAPRIVSMLCTPYTFVHCRLCNAKAVLVAQRCAERPHCQKMLWLPYTHVVIVQMKLNVKLRVLASDSDPWSLHCL